MEVNYFQILLIVFYFYFQADMQYANKKCQETNVISTGGLRVKIH